MSAYILIVDDELEERKELYERLYQDSVEKKWYDIIFATSGESALDLINNDKKQEIALIVLDLRLDGARIDGVKFINQLAQSQIHKKIIVWTGYPEWSRSFSDSAQSLIIKVCDRCAYSYSFLKDISDTFMLAQNIDPPGTEGYSSSSKKVGYRGIRQLVKSMPVEQIYQLILEIIRYLPPPLLKDLEVKFLEKIREVYDSSLERNKLRGLIAEIQEKSDALKDIPPAQELHHPWLEIVQRKYVDYHLHWYQEGHDRKKYISRRIVKKFFPVELQNPSQYLESSDSWDTLDSYYTRYYRYDT